MNLPNKLTVMRILLIPVFMVLFFVPFPWHRLAAALVFIAASFTDFLDGHIARKHNLVTDLGKFLDPIADKMLVASALIAICVTPPAVCPQNAYVISVAVFTTVILSRELMVSGFRIVAASKNIVLAADMTGKVKTVLQMCATIVLLPVADIVCYSAVTAEVFYYVGFALLAAATLMSVVSAANYLVKNRSVLEG